MLKRINRSAIYTKYEVILQLYSSLMKSMPTLRHLFLGKILNQHREQGRNHQGARNMVYMKIQTLLFSERADRDPMAIFNQEKHQEKAFILWRLHHLFYKQVDVTGLNLGLCYRLSGKMLTLCSTTCFCCQGLHPWSWSRTCLPASPTPVHPAGKRQSKK